MIDFDSLALAPCMAAFGEPVIYQPTVGLPVSLMGIFNEFAKDARLDQMSQEMMLTARPTLAFRMADIPTGIEPVASELVTVRGQDWLIAETEHDGFGQVLLKLMVARS